MKAVFALLTAGFLCFLGTSYDRVVFMYEWFPCTQHIIFEAAKELGIYQKYGLIVETKAAGFEGVSQTLLALITGAADLALSTFLDAFYYDAFSFHFIGDTVVFVTPTLDGSPYVLITLEPLTWWELGGKRGRAHDPAIFITSRLLSIFGMPLAMEPTMSWGLFSLLAGETDVTSCYLTDIAFWEAEGHHVHFLPLDKIIPHDDLWILGRRDFVENRPDVLRRFLIATQEALEYVLQNPEYAITLNVRIQEGATFEGARRAYGYLEPLWKKRSGQLFTLPIDKTKQALRLISWIFERDYDFETIVACPVCDR